MRINFANLRVILKPYLAELKGFQFSVANPLFWLGLLFMFLILLRIWELRKAFSFSVIIAILLVATTQVEHFVVSLFSSSAEVFDPILIRILFGFMVIGIGIYYFLIRQ